MLLSASVPGYAWEEHGRDHERHHRHFNAHVDVVITPYWRPWYPPVQYYYRPYYPPVIIERASAPIYVEQSAPPAPPINYWYYCDGSKTYYPYVQECPGGWRKVPPQPPVSPGLRNYP
ncbi:MAG: hypothetical protein HY066_06825 [Betaproteobacteria bacterium]|nr:hypothetical protein [Betaproteobacteria bacterium]